MAKSETISHKIAKQVTYNQKDRLKLFMENDPPLRAAIFESLSPYIQQQIINSLNTEEAVNLLDSLDLIKAKTVLAQIHSKKRREKIILRLKTELKEKAQFFLRFHAKATLELINFNYLLLPETNTVDETADEMEAFYNETKKFPEILVHKDGLLVGEIPYSRLIRSTNRTKLSKLVAPIDTIVYHADTTEAIDLLSDGHEGKVVIKDSDESVIGILYTDEARALFKAQPAASLYEFAGVAESEKPFDGVGSKVKHRYKWLIINLATAFIAAGVVSMYQETLTSLVILTMYLPVIAGMGGNAAAQTLAVMVRGISIGEISIKNCGTALKREIGAGVIHGAITGCVVALIAILFNQNPMLGLVLFLAMISSLIIAATAGTLVPLIMKRLDKDPAASATIFITTATDVLGFMSFLTLAKLILV